MNKIVNLASPFPLRVPRTSLSKDETPNREFGRESPILYDILMDINYYHYLSHCDKHVIAYILVLQYLQPNSI